MELGQEESFDKASSETNDGNKAEPNKSDSQLTLKYVRSQESFKRCRDKCTPSDLNADVIHFELLVEKGLIDKDYECPDGQDDGDHLRSVARSMEGEAIAEIVKTMRNEFMANLSSKKKNLKEILIKVKDDSSELNSISKPDHEKKSLEVTYSCSTEIKPFTEFPSKREKEMMQWINEINLFTSGMERDPENVNWGLFRANLLKMHKHYVTQKPANFNILRDHHNDLSSAGLAADCKGSLKNLGSRAVHIRCNIQGLESKMLTLDHCFDRFCDKLSRSTIAKDRVDRDLKILALLRDRIDQRLTQMEMDFVRTKNQLFCQD
ncbi:hypothetical protein KR074_000661 [Drosophila pseudoananassae]|nr:hypothetical protein KR074_000661 [Drosophila pseudoananassae]